MHWLEANEIEFEYIDITLNPPTAETMLTLFKSNDYPLKKFFNTSGVKYRELGVKTLLPDLNEVEAFNLLATDGKLIKRPFLIDDQSVLIGFKEEIWASHLKS